MIDYLAIPQPTAEWLLSDDVRRDALARSISTLVDNPGLFTSVAAMGSVRIAATGKNRRMIAIWNPDYGSGTGSEKWALLRLSNPFGLLEVERLSCEVFQRFLYIANQRLQGLILDQRCIHRSHGDDIHTCVAGRGEEARHLNLVYSDQSISIDASKLPVLHCIGPVHEVNAPSQYLLQERAILPDLAKQLNILLSTVIQRPMLDLNVPMLIAAFAPRAVPRPSARIPAITLPDLDSEKLKLANEDRSNWTYDEWIAAGSPLSSAQRAILTSDIIMQQPVRITGPAGSGKSLLMQLLAIRLLRDARKATQPRKILFIVHNTAMMESMWERFQALGAAEFLSTDNPQSLLVQTLFEYSRNVLLKAEEIPIIDKDAFETKRFQLEIVKESLVEELNSSAAVSSSKLLSQVRTDLSLQTSFAEMVVSEIGIAIKGHGLIDDRKRYVESEQPLSRLHGVVNESERMVIFDVFRRYHHKVFELLEHLDSDDLAITVLSKLRTPLWAMRRKSQGFDFVFVDETQLFNENERRLFPLLTRDNITHVPIILALDEAQELRGGVSAGFGKLGIAKIQDEKLKHVYRCTEKILKLAFHLIQRTTDLFGVEFPDYTSDSVSVISDDHPRAAEPTLYEGGSSATEMGRFIFRHAKRLRDKNFRHVAVVIHAERYWDGVLAEFRRAPNTQIFVLTKRGERIDPVKPMIVITRPDFIGGQEFDAVLAVGLEQGLVPPRVEGHDSLAAALEQQALREMYLTFTRARYRLEILNNTQSAPSSLLKDAIANGFLKKNRHDDVS